MLNHNRLIMFSYNTKHFSDVLTGRGGPRGGGRGRGTPRGGGGFKIDSGNGSFNNKKSFDDDE